MVYEDHVEKPVPLAPESTPAPPKPEKKQKSKLGAIPSDPQSLDDAAEILAARREQIASEGYQQKYTDEELKQIASSGEVNDRFLVRLIFGDSESTGSQRLGFNRPSGRAPYWATTFDMAEAADTDPEILAGLFGIEVFDSSQEYSLAIIDTESMPAQAERTSFIPTFDRMSEFGQREFTEEEGFGPNTMEGIMNDQFAEDYAVFMKGYKKTGQNIYDIKAIGPKYGVVETFTFERNTLTISELGSAVKIVPAKLFLVNSLFSTSARRPQRQYCHRWRSPN